MPRYQRDTFLHGYTYHIYNVTAGNTKLFQEEIDYVNFLAKYKKYLVPYFDKYAYCLIPNHYHIIAKVKDSFSGIIDREDTTTSKNYLENKATESEFLEHQLSRMFSSISIAYNNNKYKRRGPLFKEGTKRVIIKTQERLIDQICYTHRNSIHHGLVVNYKDWKNSSYNSYLSVGETLIKREEIIELFGGRKMFVATHENYKKGREKEFLIDCSFLTKTEVIKPAQATSFCPHFFEILHKNLLTDLRFSQLNELPIVLQSVIIELSASEDPDKYGTNR